MDHDRRCGRGYRRRFDRPVRPETFLPPISEPSGPYDVARTSGPMPRSSEHPEWLRLWGIDKDQSSTISKRWTKCCPRCRRSAGSTAMLGSSRSGVDACGRWHLRRDVVLVGAADSQIGIRLALGARLPSPRYGVRRGMLLASAGIGMGLIGAAALTRLMSICSME